MSLAYHTLFPSLFHHSWQHLFILEPTRYSTIFSSTIRHSSTWAKNKMDLCKNKKIRTWMVNVSMFSAYPSQCRRGLCLSSFQSHLWYIAWQSHWQGGKWVPCIIINASKTGSIGKTEMKWNLWKCRHWPIRLPSLHQQTWSTLLHARDCSIAQHQENALCPWDILGRLKML